MKLNISLPQWYRVTYENDGNRGEEPQTGNPCTGDDYCKACGAVSKIAKIQIQTDSI